MTPRKNVPTGLANSRIQIERMLAAELAKIVDKREEIVDDLDQRDLDAREISSILQTAAQWSTRLRSEEESSSALASLMHRAELGKDGISIKLPIQVIDKSSTAAATHLSLTRHVPMGVKRVESRCGSNRSEEPARCRELIRPSSKRLSARTDGSPIVSGRAISLDEIGNARALANATSAGLFVWPFLPHRSLKTSSPVTNHRSLPLKLSPPGPAIFPTVGRLKSNSSVSKIQFKSVGIHRPGLFLPHP